MGRTSMSLSSSDYNHHFFFFDSGLQIVPQKPKLKPATGHEKKPTNGFR
jgi:hypothetical protein